MGHALLSSGVDMSVKHLLNCEPLYLIDGSAFIYRGFYANQTLSRSDGFPTGALFIVARILLRIFREESPQRIAMVLDGKGPTFRHDLFPPYKSQRKATPEALIMQLTPIRRLTAALGIPLFVSDSCEADDCIASLCRRYRDGGVVIVGADKDLKQCLDEKVVMWDPAGREGKVTTLDAFRKETGLEPAQWPDVQAVIGDTSDNIPGVPGVGIKTAEKLFHDFTSLEDIRSRFAELPPALQNKFAGHLDAVFLYRQLTTLDTSRCADIGSEALLLKPADMKEVTGILREFELSSLQREVSGLFGSANMAASMSVQGSLFDPPPVPAAEVAQTLSSLPQAGELAGQNIAIVPEAQWLAIATGQSEWHYAGPAAPLAALLARAAASHPDTRFIAPDVKKVLHADEAWRTLPISRWFDLSIAAYLLDPEQQDYGWPRLAGHWSVELGLSPAAPGILALAMAKTLQERLDAAGLTTLLRNLEIPLIPVLADMETRGVLLDTAQLASFLTHVHTELDTLTSRIYAEAGGEFNIRSAQQLGEVLFKKLKLPVSGKTQGGQASTSKDVLDNLAGKHPVVDALLRYRVLEKLRSTYLEPLPRLAGPDGRIRTTFNQTATATGRLSSSNPNLQNIPVRGTEGKKMRFCFTAPAGRSLVSADYSQIELRVLAHVSHDPELLAAFRDGVDIHARTAGLLYDIPLEKVTPDQRRTAKTINFGLIYGMGAPKLARELAIPLADAREFISRYFKRLTALRAFYEQIKQDARAQGFVTTLSGRRRPLPGITSEAGQIRALAERQAVNTVIQGSAADIIKIAMLAVARDPRLNALDARMLLQIHDELVLEVPAEHAEEAGTRVAELMSAVTPGGIKLDVPLLVDWGTGRSWGDAH